LTNNLGKADVMLDSVGAVTWGISVPCTPCNTVIIHLEEVLKFEAFTLDEPTVIK